jgi:hypothetical protein
VYDQIRPRRESSTDSNDVDEQSGFLQYPVAAGKANVPQPSQRDPRRAGFRPSSPVVNQPSTAGVRVAPINRDAR